MNNNTIIITKGLDFHNSNDPAITYTVTNVDRKEKLVKLSFIADNQTKTSEMYLPLADKFFSDGTWLTGKGIDCMMVKLKTGYMFASGNNEASRSYEAKMEEVQGQWLEVDTQYLFNNQYNTVCGLRVMDKHVIEIKNDKRIGEAWQGKNKPQFITWGGVRPSSHCFWKEFMSSNQNPNSEWLTDHDNRFFPDNFTLDTFLDVAYHYTNNRRTDVKFLYRNGKFYNLEGGLLKGVSEKPMKALRKFFETYYK